MTFNLCHPITHVTLRTLRIRKVTHPCFMVPVLCIWLKVISDSFRFIILIHGNKLMAKINRILKLITQFRKFFIKSQLLIPLVFGVFCVWFTFRNIKIVKTHKIQRNQIKEREGLTIEYQKIEYPLNVKSFSETGHDPAADQAADPAAESATNSASEDDQDSDQIEKRYLQTRIKFETPDNDTIKLFPKSIEYFPPTLADIKEKYEKHTHNAIFAPKKLKQKVNSVAIIIPFRDRERHLQYFITYNVPILRKQNIRFKIYVIEQQDSGVFNKGRLNNAGFHIAMEDGKVNQVDWDCVIMHDVDLLIMHEGNSYRCTAPVKHLSVHGGFEKKMA